MAKIALLIEYDGSRYHGFQFQANATTVQAEMERALKKLTGEDIRVVAASRTDAGVHARGQVASFRTAISYPPRTWVGALNFYLPQDIAVRSSWAVAEDFDVRKRAVSREYRYSILNRPSRSPLRLGFAHHVPRPLDVEAMSQACQILLGEHDLASFTPVRETRGTVRTVYKASVTRVGELVHFDIAANSFLPHQVRHTAGALLRVGQGRTAVKEFQEIAQARKPGLAGPAAPARGLCLMKVSYPHPLGEYKG